jgi:ubiquinone/menaquinone biosynthesis C-methylase UbiE
MIVFEVASLPMLIVLKSKISVDGSVEIIHSDIFDYKKQDIDLVFSCMSFNHVPDIDNALDNFF